MPKTCPDWCSGLACCAAQERSRRSRRSANISTTVPRIGFCVSTRPLQHGALAVVKTAKRA
eukprot:8871498-Pyramimonas_sp.AAC.1